MGPIRLPAASTPMSAIVTPPSFKAAIVASAARSKVSLSGCLPNLVMAIPRIHTSSLAMMGRSSYPPSRLFAVESWVVVESRFVR